MKIGCLSRASRRLWTRAGMVLAAGLLAVVAVPTAASANNDPHRFFDPAGTVTLSGLCAFPVTFTTLVDNEYSSSSTGPDGSTIVKTSGSLVQQVTNDNTGKSITVNASGPGIVTIPASGSLITIDSQGLGSLAFLNLTDFGFPSDAVITSGALQLTFDASTDTIVSMTMHPQLHLDECAAVS